MDPQTGVSKLMILYIPTEVCEVHMCVHGFCFCFLTLIM